MFPRHGYVLKIQIEQIIKIIMKTKFNFKMSSFTPDFRHFKNQFFLPLKMNLLILISNFH